MVARVARSDDAAFAALYDRHARAAYGLALRVVRDRALADDAVQDGFLCVWRCAGQYRPERATVATWIFTLVHRRAVDIVRRERRRSCDPIDGRHERERGDGRNSLTEASLRQRRGEVQAALARLAPEQRGTLELAYYGGYTQREIAARQGVPLGTVKSRGFAGLSRLRELLEPGGYGASDCSPTS